MVGDIWVQYICGQCNYLDNSRLQTDLSNLCDFFANYLPGISNRLFVLVKRGKKLLINYGVFVNVAIYILL